VAHVGVQIDRHLEAMLLRQGETLQDRASQAPAAAADEHVEP
jgi:hypothetical protein